MFLRSDVPPLSVDTNANKLRKANHLVQQLAGRAGGRDFSDLVQYVGSANSGLSAAFRRGSAESVDFYANLDRDTPAKATPQPRAARTFTRPGTTAPTPPPPPTPATARRYVFVVRGRDQDAYNAVVALLTSLDLRVVTWDEASSSAGGGTPHTLDIVGAGIEMSNAVVVLMTPDDVGHVKGDFYDPVRDDPREARPTGQARQNVVFEAGWAMALNQDGVILVRVGDVRPLSDIEGLNYVWLDNDIGSRRQFISRLRNCRLEVHDNHDRWRTAGTFPER